MWMRRYYLHLVIINFDVDKVNLYITAVQQSTTRGEQRTPVHSARDCLSQRGSNCGNISCRKWLNIIEVLIAFTARALCRHQKIARKTGSGDSVTEKETKPRGRSRKGRIKDESENGPVKVGLLGLKPLILGVRGGAPREKIDVIKYCNALEIRKIPLHIKLMLDEVRTVGYYWYEKKFYLHADFETS